MALVQHCDLCGHKYLRDISKFCDNCGEKRMEQGVVEEEDVLEVQEEGNMRGPPARVALREKHVNTVSYLQVFAPPACRTENKVYGKKALLVGNMGIQHRIMLNNYEEVKRWVVVAQESGRLPQGAFSLEEEGVQARLRQIVKENCESLQELKLGRKNHKWGETKIYKYLKQHLRYLRKKRRNSDKLTANEVNQEDEENEVEEDRQLLVMDSVQNMESIEASVRRRGDTQESDGQSLGSIEDDESFLLLTLSLPTVDVMRKHLKKVMEDLNRRVAPKPFGVGYRRWDKDKQVREVSKYYRQRWEGSPQIP